MFRHTPLMAGVACLMVGCSATGVDRASSPPSKETPPEELPAEAGTPAASDAGKDAGNLLDAEAPPTQPATVCSGDSPPLGHLLGEMVGEVTESSAILQSRLTAPEIDSSGDVPGHAGVARFELSPDDSFDSVIQTDWLVADADRDFIVKARVGGLSPGTRYQYRLVFGQQEQEPFCGPMRSFTTAPGAQSLSRTQFVVVTGMHYDKGDAASLPEGFPALRQIIDLQPDFFVGTGDNVYYDHSPRATTQPEIRKKWHEQFVKPLFVELFGSTATYWEKDDHDYRFDDADRSGTTAPSHELGVATFREQVPVVDPTDPDAPTYRTHRLSRLLQIWLPEGRDYRSNNGMPDGPDKTIWGAEQKEWLKASLLASDATFKLIVHPTPMVGPDDARKRDNHTNIGGFRDEGTAFFDWAKQNGLLERGLYIICGDRHWQYHAVHPSGFEEFSTGALVDGNARLGRNPGDPQSTDPDATITQLFTSPEATGGFLNVVAEPDSSLQRATLSFNFFDEQGNVIHHVSKERSIE